MKISKILLVVMLAFALVLSQSGAVFAASINEDTLLSGTVQSITLETDPNTAVTTILVTILDGNNASQTVRLSVGTAKVLGLITIDANGTPVINTDVFGKTIQIDPKTVIVDDEANLHPVGDALATFFGEITDYETIMAAHTDGIGFGVLAQALWLTQKLEGDSTVFLAILLAKETGDYSVFILEDGTSPKNWGQFRKAILDGEKKGSLGIVMSNKDKDNNENGQNNGSNNGNGNSNKDKDKGNNDNGNKDKDKDKTK